MPSTVLADRDRQAIGTRIAVLREMLELTQTEFGRRVHASQPTVSCWETGRHLPNLRMQHVIADVLRRRRSEVFKELVVAEDRAVA